MNDVLVQLANGFARSSDLILFWVLFGASASALVALIPSAEEHNLVKIGRGLAIDVAGVVCAVWLVGMSDETRGWTKLWMILLRIDAVALGDKCVDLTLAVVAAVRRWRVS